MCALALLGRATVDIVHPASEVLAAKTLSELEYLLPSLFVFRPLRYFFGADRIELCRAKLFHRLHLRMRRQAPSRSVSFLSFLASGPPIEEPGCVGMGSVLGQRVGGDRRNPFGQHISERCAFFDSQRIVVRVTCHTGSGL